MNIGFLDAPRSGAAEHGIAGGFSKTPCKKSLKHAASTIATENLSRIVDGKVLVRDVSVALAAGEVLAVVGPSGSGKTSFLRMLNRLDEPTSGVVRLDGSDYREMKPQALRKRVGMVMQTAHLFSGTVAENIAFGPSQSGVSIHHERTAALLQRVGLAGYQDRDVANLSGGEAQRVSIARTLANDPEVLLLDEPTSALDEESARRVEELIADIIRERGMTCVIVTHSAPQALRIADRAMVMEAGEILKIGTAQEVLANV